MPKHTQCRVLVAYVYIRGGNKSFTKGVMKEKAHGDKQKEPSTTLTNICRSAFDCTLPLKYLVCMHTTYIRQWNLSIAKGQFSNEGIVYSPNHIDL